MLEWKKWEIKTIYKDELPEQLQRIKNCPEKLYYRGEWNDVMFKKSLAVVGSRKMTRYGREVISKFVPELVANGFCLISGFMYGVDSEVHRTCVELGGRTVAVLGFGLNYLSPPENDDLYTRILETGGLVISEYERDQKGSLWTFPQRNRIVAGLATEGTLVIEAGLKSGSLITARLTKEQGKKVLAIPGPINATSSEGTNWLIKNNEGLMIVDVTQITNTSTVIDQLDIFDWGNNSVESKIQQALKRESLSTDELAKEIGVGISEVSMAITKLAMQGKVTDELGKIYLCS